MRKYLVVTSLFTLALVAGCQSGPPTYYGPCSQLAQDAGTCTGPRNFGSTLDPLVRG